MFTISSITQKARETLKTTPGIYRIAVIPVLISLVIQFVSATSQSADYWMVVAEDGNLNISYLLSSALFPIFYGLLMSLLYLSISMTLFKGIKHGQADYSISSSLHVFQQERFKDILLTFLLKKFLLFLWGIVFYVGISCLIGSVAILLGWMLSTGITDPNQVPYELVAVSGLLFLGGLALSLIGLAIYIPQVYAYSQVEFLLFDQLDEDRFQGPLAVIKGSRKLMKGYKGKRLLLDLRFIGWFILSAITFGIAGLYIWPYYYAAQVHFYQALLAEQTT